MVAVLRHRGGGFQPAFPCEINPDSPFVEGLNKLVVFNTQSNFGLDLVTRRIWRPFANATQTTTACEASQGRAGAAGRPQASASFDRKYWRPNDDSAAISTTEWMSIFVFFEYEARNGSGAILEAQDDNRVIRINASLQLEAFYSSGVRFTTTAAIEIGKPTTFLVASSTGNYAAYLNGVTFEELLGQTTFGSMNGLRRIGGSNAGSTGSVRGKYYLVAEWRDRRISPAAYQMLHQDPWQMVRPVAAKRHFWVGGSSTTPVDSDHVMEIDWSAAIRDDSVIPVESKASINDNNALVVEYLASVMRDAPVPYDWLGGVRADRGLNVESKATIQDDNAVRPEWKADIVPAGRTVALDWLQTVRQDAEVPADWLATIRGDAVLRPAWSALIRSDHGQPADWIVVVNGARPVNVDWLSTIRTDRIVPVDFSLLIRMDSQAPADWLATIQAGAVIPAEWRGAVLIDRDGVMAVDWSAVVVADRVIPVDHGTVIVVDRPVPAEWLSAVAVDRDVVAEWLQRVSVEGSAPVEWTLAIVVTQDATFPIDWDGIAVFQPGNTFVFSVDAAGVVYVADLRDVVFAAGAQGTVIQAVEPGSTWTAEARAVIWEAPAHGVVWN